MDTSLISPETVHVGILVVTLGTLIGIASCVVNIWSKFRRRPSVEETLRKEYVSRAEYQQFLHENHADLDDIRDEIKNMRASNAAADQAIFNEIRLLSASMNKEMQDINKSIGRLEGYLNKEH